MSTQEKQETLAKKLSKLAAACIGKPEQYVMACVHDNVAMTMGGESTAAALVSVKSIGGLSKEVNKKLSEETCQILRKELGVADECIYITFEELPATHWGWKADTFG
jgi:phenylpyruvate tautomerase PptA (4-oxalocrotonate tautomerase family)